MRIPIARLANIARGAAAAAYRFAKDNPKLTAAGVSAAIAAAGYALPKGREATAADLASAMNFVQNSGDSMRVFNASVAALAALPVDDRTKAYESLRSQLPSEDAAVIIEAVDTTISAVAHSGDAVASPSGDKESYDRMVVRANLVKRCAAILHLYDVTDLIALRQLFAMDYDYFMEAIDVAERS